MQEPNTIPRYIVLNAILIEIERLKPESFATYEEAKEVFRIAIQIAEESVFTDPQVSELDRQIVREERELLYRFIDEMTEKELAAVEPMFYRRILSKEESRFVREKLRSVWSVNGYWYPLENKQREDVEAFQIKYFDEEIGSEKLQELLKVRKVEKMFNLLEFNPDYEIELSILEPLASGSETFWCDNSFDWVIYVSHESSITFCGWLLSEIKNVWTNWEKRIWTTPFYE